jgi:hypothetical protein
MAVIGVGWFELLDTLLGWAEVILVPFSVVWLLAAIVKRDRRRVRVGVVVALVLCITVAEPFGVKGVPITRAQFAAGHPRAADSQGIHSVAGDPQRKGARDPVVRVSAVHG